MNNSTPRATLLRAKGKISLANWETASAYQAFDITTPRPENILYYSYRAQDALRDAIRMLEILHLRATSKRQ